MPETGTNSKLRVWLWVLGGLAAALAIALVVVLVTQDDGGSDQAATTSTSSTSTTLATTTTTTPPTTTTLPATTTTTIPYPSVTSDPQTYAQYLFVAWQNNSQTSAANVASAMAIGEMFSQPYSTGAGWQFGNCDPAAGSLYCVWNASSGAKLTMQVRTLTGGQPIQVTGVTRS
jgi:hypothetical protein